MRVTPVVIPLKGAGQRPDNLTSPLGRIVRPPPAPTRLASVLGLLVLSASGALAQSYPRLGRYGRILGNGYPYTTGGVIQGPFDTATLDAVARYDQVILTVTPISEYRP